MNKPIILILIKSALTVVDKADFINRNCKLQCVCF